MTITDIPIFQDSRLPLRWLILAGLAIIVVLLLVLTLVSSTFNKPAKCCDNTYPNALKCDNLWYTYKSPQQALKILKQETGRSSLNLSSKNPSESGPCPQKGWHYRSMDGKDYVASIMGCPCCQDTPSGPIMTWLYGIW